MRFSDFQIFRFSDFFSNFFRFFSKFLSLIFQKSQVPSKSTYAVIYGVASNFYNLKKCFAYAVEQLFQKKRAKSLQVEVCSHLRCGEQLLQPKKMLCLCCASNFFKIFCFGQIFFEKNEKFLKNFQKKIMQSFYFTNTIFSYHFCFHYFTKKHKNIFFIFFHFFAIFKTQKLFRFFFSIFLKFCQMGFENPEKTKKNENFLNIFCEIMV